MTVRPVVIGAALLMLAACGQGGLSTGDAARNRAPGIDAEGTGVDGLLVGHRLMEAGEYDLALRAYLRGAAEQGMTPDVLSALGSVNLKLGRLGQAERLLRQAVEADPQSVPALNNLGVVLMERGQIGEARLIFQQAFAADSGASDSIRENLKLAIARSEGSLYDETRVEPAFSLVRRDRGQYVLLSEL